MADEKETQMARCFGAVKREADFNSEFTAQAGDQRVEINCLCGGLGFLDEFRSGHFGC